MDMRIALAAIVVFVGVNIGLVSVDNFKDMQDKRMAAYCKADPSLCN